MYSRGDFTKAFDDFIEKHGRLPEQSELNKQNYLPSAIAVKKIVGTLQTFYKEQYPELYIQRRKKFSSECAERYRERRGFTDEKFADELLKKIDAFVVKYDRPPKMAEFKAEYGLVSKNTVIKHLGDIKKLLKHRYPEYYKEEWDAAKIHRSVELFRIRHQRLPLLKEFKKANNLPTERMFKKICGDGDIYHTLKSWYPEYEVKNRKLAKEDIYSMIDRFIEQNGRIPIAKEYRKENGLPSYQAVKKHCGNIREILKEKYPYLIMPRNIWSVEKIKSSIDNFIEIHGKLPKVREFSKENKLPSAVWIRKNTNKSVAAFLAENYPQYVRTYRVRAAWNRDKVIEAVAMFISENERLPISRDFNSSNNLPCKTVFMEHLGCGIDEFFKVEYPELYINKEGKWSETKIYNAIGKFIDKTGGLPMVSDFRPSNELPSLKTFVKYCGTGTMEYYKKYYPEQLSKKCQSHKWTKESILQSIRTFIERNVEFPNAKDFHSKNGMPSIATTSRVFGGVKNALREYAETVGINYTGRHEWNKESILTAIDEYVNEYKCLPERKDIAMKDGLPHISTINRYFGSWKTLLNKHYPQYDIQDRRRGHKNYEAESGIVRKAIDDYINENDKVPSNSAISEKTGIGYSVIIKSLGMTKDEYCQENYPQYYQEKEDIQLEDETDEGMCMMM